MYLSVVMITKNVEGEVGEALDSVRGIADEVLVSDEKSQDGTINILEKYRVKITSTSSVNLGERKNKLVQEARGNWVLVLDADERVSPELQVEIRRIIVSEKNKDVAGYLIPYQNYVFGRPVYYGGERYSKVRLFRKGCGALTADLLHEEVVVDGKILTLRGVIHHYSFRTFRQLFGKFTRYAFILARQKKLNGESAGWKQLFLYGVHMFWARYIKEEGYRDGWRGVVLAAAFGYMETLIYWSMFVYSL